MFRAGARAVDINALIQTIGTENFGGTVGVGAVPLFASVAPGDDFHFSPMVGGVLDGVAMRLRFNFRARSH